MRMGRAWEGSALRDVVGSSLTDPSKDENQESNYKRTSEMLGNESKSVTVKTTHCTTLLSTRQESSGNGCGRGADRLQTWPLFRL